MAKQWFSYTNTATTYSAQVTPANYLAVGAYPPTACALANRTCLLYSFYSSTSPVRPSATANGIAAISSNLQTYIAAFASDGQPVEAQPISGKKFIYVKGS